LVPAHGRLDQLKPGQAVPPASEHVDGLNARAARWAREEASREEVLAAFHHTHTQLIQRLKAVPMQDREEPFTIRCRSLTLTEYLEGVGRS
jgi:hypothetical protein